MPKMGSRKGTSRRRMFRLGKVIGHVRIPVREISFSLLALFIILEWRREERTPISVTVDSQKNGGQLLSGGRSTEKEARGTPTVSGVPAKPAAVENFTEFEEVETYLRTTLQCNNLTMFEGTNVDNNEGTMEDNYKNLSRMLYRVVLYYNITRIVDTSCYLNRMWVPDAIRAITQVADVLDRRIYYTCIDSHYDRVKAEIRPQMRGLRKVFFMKRAPWKDELPNGDLVLAWEILQGMSFHRVQNFTNTLKKMNTRYLLATDNPDVDNSADFFELAYHRKALRLEPLNFPEPEKEFAGLSDVKTKHGMLYDIKKLPDFTLREQ